MVTLSRGKAPPPRYHPDAAMRGSMSPLSPPISLAGAGCPQGPCWVLCPAPGPPRCPPALRSRRKVGGLRGRLTPRCCLSPAQGLPTAMGHWLPQPSPHNRPHRWLHLASPHHPSSILLAPPVLMGGPNPAPCPTPCPPSPHSAPTAPPPPPTSATGSSDGGTPPGAPPHPATGGTETQQTLGTVLFATTEGMRTMLQQGGLGGTLSPSTPSRVGDRVQLLL